MRTGDWLCVLRGDGSLPVVLSSEHAGDWLPGEYGTLGLAPDLLDTCPDAYDRGAAEIFATLASRLRCDGIESRLCRLLIDLNRYLDQDTLIPARCGDAVIPANVGLPDAERQHRVERFYLPYQRRLLALLTETEQRHGRAFLFAIHTMAEEHFGERRTMDFAFACNRGCPIAGSMAARLEGAGWSVRVNEPFRLLRDVLRVPGGVSAERFNDTAVLVEVNDRLRHDERVVVELDAAIRYAMAVRAAPVR